MLHTRHALALHLLSVVLACLAACRTSSPTQQHSTATSAATSTLRVVDAKQAVVTWNVDALAKVGVVDVEWSHRGVVHHYRGVPLNRLYKSEAAEVRSSTSHRPGSARRDGGCVVVIAVGGDDYRALFSAAELTDDFGSTDAFVVWEEAGHALPDDEGPLRLVVTTDQGGARGVRQMQELRIIDLGATQPPAAK